MHIDKIRSFIALEVPGDIQSAITNGTLVLKRLCPPPLIRWVPTHNIHLTLKFLGDMTKDVLDLLAANLIPAIAEIPSFQITVSGLGAFPNPRRPRILWVGLDASGILNDLETKVKDVVTRLGISSDERESSYHLTIGRVNRNASDADFHKISNSLSQLEIKTLGSFTVHSVQIFRSDLSPLGASYSRLISISLSG